MTGTFRKNVSGFTLVELMIVVTVLAILVGISAPRFEGWNRINRLKSGVRQVATSIQNARFKAINANRRCYLDFAPGSLTPADSFFTIWLDVDGDQSYDIGEIDSTMIGFSDTRGGFPGLKLPRGVGFGVNGPTSGPEGMAVAADGVDFNGADLVGFNAQGEGTAGVVYLTGEGGDIFAVAVSRLGRVRTYRWEDNQWR
jgi:prepilin-type N-terminal cleavage/methylation domain-containing protein